MGNDLTVFSDVDTTIQKYTEETFKDISKSGDYLRRVQLCGANTSAVKKKKVGMGNYGIFTDKDNVEDLGDDVQVVPVAWRPKALQITSGKDGDTILNYYDPSKDDFKNVVAQGDVKDSGCMYGPEYLIWIPKIKELATFFCNSKTQRRAAKSLQPLLKNPVAMRSTLIESGQYSWHGSVFLASSEPITAVPDADKLKAVVEKFLNPPENAVEIDPTVGTDNTRAR